MNTVFAVLSRVAIAVVVPMSAFAAEPLFGFKITQTSANGNAHFTLQFKEVERTTSTSIVEMVYTPERNGVDQTQLTYGACLLMKARGEQFVDVRQVAQSPARFEVTFPRGVNEQPLGAGGYLSAAQCQRFVSMFSHVG
jgi:hypothetical protein